MFRTLCECWGCISMRLALGRRPSAKEEEEASMQRTQIVIKETAISLSLNPNMTEVFHPRLPNNVNFKLPFMSSWRVATLSVCPISQAALFVLGRIHCVYLISDLGYRSTEYRRLRKVNLNMQRTELLEGHATPKCPLGCLSSASKPPWSNPSQCLSPP